MFELEFFALLKAESFSMGNWKCSLHNELHDNKDNKDIGTGEDLQDSFTTMGIKVVTNEQHREVTMHLLLPQNKVIGHVNHCWPVHPGTFLQPHWDILLPS